MAKSGAITRIKLRNFKSIASCDVKLSGLTYLVGANGSGKSNFLDSFHFARDALTGSLDNAINERGGISEVRRRSRGHPNHFGMRFDFTLHDGTPGHYAFEVGALSGGEYQVRAEECAVGRKGNGPFFRVKKGEVMETSETALPATSPDRLALVAASGLKPFRPVFELLTQMGFYNLNPKLISELQKPQDGRLLRAAGENISSVVDHMERNSPERLGLVREYLGHVVPLIEWVRRLQVGPMETLEFKQEVAGDSNPWRFYAQSMSDGTLRAFAVLVALFQGDSENSPTLIGIEEPETALHPAATAALREALVRASRETQVIVTSHSPDLLDDPGLNSDDIRIVVSDKGKTIITEIDEATRKTVREHLYTAGEMLRLNQIEINENAKSKQQKQLDLFGSDI